MKCTNCGSTKFYKMKNYGIDISGDARIDFKRSTLEGYVCSNCRLIQWYDHSIFDVINSLQV